MNNPIETNTSSDLSIHDSEFIQDSSLLTDDGELDIDLNDWINSIEA